jgi:hypothetical protein
MNKIILVIFAVFIVCSSAIAGSSVTRESGGSIKTELAPGIVLNTESSLHREWIAIHNDALPVDLVGTPGVKTIYDSGGRYSSGNYRYKANYLVKTNQDLMAIEVRFLTFDIWGELLRNLSTTQIMDLKSGETRNLDAEWNVFSENEVKQYYASIAYISQVRLTTGRVIKADPNMVVQEAQKFSAKFKASDLEPESKKK